MAEFSRAEMLSDANFPLFKIPKQWSYTIPVFPILLVSRRTLFHCGGGGCVDKSKKPRAEQPNIKQYYYCVDFFKWGCLE